MKKKVTVTLGLVLAFLFFSIGCGYFKAGQWDDDSRNWQRAFGGPVPNGWSVLHSRYWRFPHWTYEGGFYFDVKVPPGWRQKLMNRPDLIKYEPSQSTDMDGACLERPKWFAPGSVTSYDVWTSHGTGNYRLFVEKEGSEVFFSDCQY